MTAPARLVPPPPPSGPRPAVRSTTGPAVARSPQGDARLPTGFWVAIDGIQLPSFSECQGLGASYDVTQWPEGGVNDRVHQLPGRLTHSPITLTRMLDGASGALAAWFNSVLDRKQPYKKGVIKVCGPDGKSIAHWDLVDVFPTRYTGPGLTSGGTSVLTESIEIVHHGFVFAYDPPPGRS